MINEATIRMRFPVYIIDRIQIILKAFIHSNTVTLCLSTIIRH